MRDWVEILGDWFITFMIGMCIINMLLIGAFSVAVLVSR